MGIFFFGHPGLEPGSRCLILLPANRSFSDKKEAGSRLKAGMTTGAAPSLVETATQAPR